MTSPSLDGYSHEKMVSVISSFFAFLKGMHSESGGNGAFRYPPKDGWAHVTREIFPFYSERVVELIRHLPFYEDENYQMMPDTSLLAPAAPNMCALLAKDIEQEKAIGEGKAKGDKTMDTSDEDEEEDLDTVPSYVFALAAGRRYGSSVLVDTKYNTVIWWKYDNTYLALPDEISSKYPCVGCHADYCPEFDSDGIQVEAENIDDGGPDAWKMMAAFSPEDFFEFCKEQFRILNWLPVLDECARGKVMEVSEHQVWHDSSQQKMMQIMKDAGWPGDGEGGGWDKAGAEAAMQKMADEEAAACREYQEAKTNETLMNWKMEEMKVGQEE